MAERTNGKVATDKFLCCSAGMTSLEEADNRIVLHIETHYEDEGGNHSTTCLLIGCCCYSYIWAFLCNFTL